MQMKNVFIGASGYSYKDWLGIFYPKEIKPSEYLDYYVKFFNFCELNFSYYALPKAKNMEMLAKKVPPGFQFSIKGHQSLTHERSGDWKNSVQKFQEGIKPISEKGLLGSVLMQFPFSFHYTVNNRKYLSDLCDHFEGSPLCLEFRNRDWHISAVYEELKKRNLCMVWTDMPNLKDLPDYFSVEKKPDLCGDILYLRFHGRNKENWWTGNNATRYDYLYSSDELSPWADVIKKLISEVKKTLIAFNNHLKGNAVKNSRQLKELLNRGQSGADSE